MKKHVIEDGCNPDIENKKELNKALPENVDEDALYETASILKALSDPTRIQILCSLRNNDLCVCEMMSLLEKPQSTLSHHLIILKNAGLIKPRKKGVWNYYTLIRPEIGKFLDNVLLEKF
jgi:ArsR family transcriptional regulator